MKNIGVCCLVLLAGVSIARSANVDPQYASLAAQIFAAGDDGARTALLDANRELAKPALVRAMNELAGKAYDRRDFAAALQMYEAACTVAGRIGDPRGLANCTYDSGLVHSELYQKEAALERFQSAISAYEALGAHEDLARVLNSAATLYRRSGDLNAALPFLNRAMQEAERSGNPVSVAQTNTNLANVYKSLGRYREGIQALQKALEITRRQPELDRRTAMIMNNLGGLYYDQHDLALALSYHTQALALKEKLQVSPAELATSVLNLGVDHKEMGDYAKAVVFFDRAMDLTEKSSNLIGRSLVLYNYADLLYLLGRKAEAREKLEAEIAISSRISDREGVANGRIELGEIAVDEHRFEDALEFARPALEFGRLQGDLRIVTRAQDVIGRALTGLRRYDEANTAFEDGIRVVESLRDQLPGERQMAARFLESQVAIYQHMVELQVARRRPDLAFAWSESSKGRALLDALQTGRTDIAKSLTAGERAQESLLAGGITRVNEEILHESQKEAPDRRKVAELGSQLEAARNRYESFLVALYATHPQLKVERVAFDPVKPAELVASLPDSNTALVEYSLTDGGAYLFVITRGAGGGADLNVYAIPGSRKQLERDVKIFRDRIASHDLDYRTLALSLYRRLLAPAARQIRGKSTLVIVPDSSLWQVPFQALESGPDRYLIEDHAIFYAPSLSVLYEIRKLHRAPEPAGKRLLAVDAVRLPDARREVEGLREIYGAANVKIYSGGDADEARLKNEGSKYQVVHVAAHGVFEDRNPMNSYLVLAKAGKPEAGVLEARRMMDLNLRADMVVLSGCETGRGAGASEGLLGMSWALFIAGSPSTVASQWKVEAGSTSDLMLGFHRNVQYEGKAKALQQAELAVMKNPEYRHPFYWSSFVLVGQGF